jgi:4-amino-4-deoxy-L-arabinose transferase-like glycosyltransferase
VFQAVTPDLRRPFVWGTLTIMTAGGAALRFYHLGYQSLWYDEIVSWYASGHPTIREIAYRDIQWNMYPPGFHLILRASREVFGDSEWALRLPSAAAGVMTIPLMYALAARFWSYRQGLIAAGLTSVLLFPIYFAQEARPYSLLLAAVVFATLCWTYFVDTCLERRRPPGAAIAGYAAGAAACMYLHYFGLFFILIQAAQTVAILGWARRPRALVVCIAGYALLAIAYIPWMPGFWWHWRNQAIGPQNPPLDANVAVGFYDYISSLFNHAQTGSWLSFIINTVFLILAGGVAVQTFRETRQTGLGAERKPVVLHAAILIVWLFVPFLFAYIKSSVSASVFTHRNLIVSLPAVYLITAHGLARLPGPGLLRNTAATALIAGALIRVLVSGYYTAPHKDQYREAVQYMVERESAFPDATIIGYGNSTFSFDYYLDRLNASGSVARWAGKGEDIPALVEMLNAKRPRYVWYLCAEPFPDAAFRKYLNEHFQILANAEFVRVYVFLFAPKYPLPPP